MFFVFKPDFEMKNFTLNELSRIAYELGKGMGINDIELVKIEEATKDVNSAKDFFIALEKLDNRFSAINKGKDWGIVLVRYALQYPLGQIFGDENDRLINQVIEIIYQCCEYMYEPTRQNYIVDSKTGKLVER